MFRRLIVSLVLSLSLLVGIGCGARIYNVTPVPSSAPASEAGNEQGVIAKTAILDGDQTLDRFEANLPLAGVIAIEVQINNRTSETVKADSLKFELRDAGGNLKQIVPSKALKRVMKFYGNSFYRKDAKVNTFKSYEDIGLPTHSAIAPQSELRGFLFYETQINRTSISGLTFSVGGATKQINVTN